MSLITHQLCYRFFIHKTGPFIDIYFGGEGPREFADKNGHAYHDKRKPIPLVRKSEVARSNPARTGYFLTLSFQILPKFCYLYILTKDLFISGDFMNT